MRRSRRNKRGTERNAAGAGRDLAAAGGRFRVLVGDVRDRLRELPEEAVHCVVTSPPYFGLRDYGTEPLVWGGDPACSHEWGSLERGKRKDMLPADATTSAARSGTTRRQDGAAHDGGRFCRLCGAWRGSLGQEPTPELYIEHLIEVFREVRRVLRKDGTAWLVIGDCYATAPPGNRRGKTKDASGLPNSRANLEMRRSAQARRRDYGGLKQKDLVMLPARVALALSLPPNLGGPAYLNSLCTRNTGTLPLDPPAGRHTAGIVVFQLPHLGHDGVFDTIPSEALSRAIA